MGRGNGPKTSRGQRSRDFRTDGRKKSKFGGLGGAAPLSHVSSHGGYLRFALQRFSSFFSKLFRKVRTQDGSFVSPAVNIL
jgi:hypothetical protein